MSWIKLLLQMIAMWRSLQGRTTKDEELMLLSVGFEREDKCGRISFVLNAEVKRTVNLCRELGWADVPVFGQVLGLFMRYPAEPTIPTKVAYYPQEQLWTYEEVGYVHKTFKTIEEMEHHIKQIQDNG